MEAIQSSSAQTKARHALSRRVARYLRIATCDESGQRISPDGARAIVGKANALAATAEGRVEALAESKEYHRDEVIYEREQIAAKNPSYVRSADVLDRLPEAETFTKHPRTIKPITLIRLLVAEIAGMDSPAQALVEVLHQCSMELDEMGDATPPGSDDEPEAPRDDARTVATKKRYLKRREQRALDQREAQGYQVLDSESSAAFDSTGFTGQLQRRTTNVARFSNAPRPEGTVDTPPSRRATRRATKLDKRMMGKGGGPGWMRELDALDAKKLMDAASVGQTGIVERFILRSVNRVPGAPPLEELFKTQHPQLGSVRRRFFFSSPALRSTSFGLEFL